MDMYYNPYGSFSSQAGSWGCDLLALLFEIQIGVALLLGLYIYMTCLSMLFCMHTMYFCDLACVSDLLLLFVLVYFERS